MVESSSRRVQDHQQEFLTDSRIDELAIPIMEEGKPVAAKVLPPFDEEAVRLLKALKGYHFGHSSVSIKRNLIVYEGIKVPESWAPCFKDESS